jgi:hypothetical protein
MKVRRLFDRANGSVAPPDATGGPVR